MIIRLWADCALFALPVFSLALELACCARKNNQKMDEAADNNKTQLTKGAQVAAARPEAEPPLDWSQRAFYLAAVVALLMFSALILLLICYYSREDSDADEEPACAKANNQRLRPAGGGGGGNTKPTSMISSLHKSAKHSDVILAQAMSSIPLRELGGKNNEVVVNVTQQLDLDRKQIQPPDYECVACKSMKHISVACKQVLCYAQMTIGVLVYKREDERPTIEAKDTQPASKTRPPAK